MRISKNELIAKVVKTLLKEGWIVRSTKRHMKLGHPEKPQVVTVPGTPSDNRAAMNWVHQLRRQGIIQSW